MDKAHFGLIGLGVMGENLVLNAERNGFSSVVYNRTYAKTEEFLNGRGAGKQIIGASSLDDFVSKLQRPRRILMMIKAGDPIDAMIEQISPLLEEGDLLIDGGNSLYTDTERRVAELESKSFGYIGMGVSGGAKGALEGPSMMPGGTKAAYDAIESLVRKMAAQVDDADVLKQWNATEELSSFLVEITEICLRTKDPADGTDLVEKIVDAAGQKGTGLWTVESALQMGVPVPTIYAALNARVLSSMRKERMAAESLLAPPASRALSLGSPADAMAPLMDACVLACIASYAQGMALLQEASSLHNYNLDMSAIGQIWKGGCIIRARLLQRIQNAYTANAELPNLMVDPWFADQIRRRIAGLRQVVAGAAQASIPVPCLSSSLDYIDSYFTGRLPQNLVQAMRDCFGSHTYERVDQPGTFHTEWM
jgi:6-phosphogluconate dehydrogenase